MGSRYPIGRSNLEGNVMPRHARRHSDVSCAKTAESIEIPFGLWTPMGQGKHVIDRGPDPHAMGQFLGNRICPCMPDDTLLRCPQTAEPIELPFELWAQIGSSNHVIEVAPMFPPEGVLLVSGPLQSIRFRELDKRVRCA